ncbi:hypothetical protein D3C73_1011640 [compost metagenome]
MVLGFLAVVGERHVVAAVHRRMACQRHRRGGRQRNALVRRAKQHVELHTGIQQRLGVELGQLADRAAAVEQAGIEEVRADPTRFDLEAAKAQHAFIKGEADEFQGADDRRGGRGGGGHASGSGGWQTPAFYPLSGLSPAPGRRVG